MATLEELQVKISADTSALRADLQRLNSTVSSSTNKMQGAFNGVAASLRGLVPALSAAAFVSFGRSVIDSAGKLQDLSERIGFTASTLSALQPALNGSGSSIDQLASLVVRLNNILGEAAAGNETARKAFTNLGLSVEELLALTPEQQLLAVADSLGKISVQSELAAAGQDIFGRQFASFIPVIKMANGSLSDYVETQKQLGEALSDETIATLDRFGDAAEKSWLRVRNAAAEALAASIQYVEYISTTTLAERRAEAIRNEAAAIGATKIPSQANANLDAILAQAGVNLPSSAAQSRIPAQDLTKVFSRIPPQTGKAAAAASSNEIERGAKKVTKAVEEQADAYQRLEDQRKAQADAERERQDMMRQYAYSFESAFEDAIIQGKKLSDVLDELGKDILRSVLRAQITAPLTESISGGIGSMFGGGNFFSSLISALPSFDVGTPYVPRDMLAMVHKGEAIIPANQNKPGGGVAINIINNSSAQVSASQQQSGNGMDIRVMIDEAVAANIARSGSRTSQAINSYNNRALVRR